MSSNLAGGRNIAMRVPPRFGANQLWIGRAVGMSQAEMWLELVADDVPATASRLEAAGTVRCDDIEALSDGFEGFWISNPASIIHIVSKPEQ